MQSPIDGVEVDVMAMAVVLVVVVVAAGGHRDWVFHCKLVYCPLFLTSLMVCPRPL
jgi:hypothetical protein